MIVISGLSDVMKTSTGIFPLGVEVWLAKSLKISNFDFNCIDDKVHSQSH